MSALNPSAFPAVPTMAMNPKHQALAEGNAVARALVVVDDEVDARRIAMTLDAYGYDLDLLRTAEEAILRDPRKYALVVCEARLPGIGGATFAEIVRRCEGSAAPPFVFIGRTEGLGTADACLERPFSMRELVATIAAAVGVRASGVFVAPTARFGGAAAPSSSSGLPPGGSGRRGRARRSAPPTT